MLSQSCEFTNCSFPYDQTTSCSIRWPKDDRVGKCSSKMDIIVIPAVHAKPRPADTTSTPLPKHQQRGNLMSTQAVSNLVFLFLHCYSLLLYLSQPPPKSNLESGVGLHVKVTISRDRSSPSPPLSPFSHQPLPITNRLRPSVAVRTFTHKRTSYRRCPPPIHDTSRSN